ncbi:putative glycosyltransferase, group 1 [Bradyrhizobium sp. ORS 285]|uniref:glycosyltransferase family 4 protein n=1 Tax=Bradyrhizobium sp. ORS 285 TaxID=115808 RepID=UPI0002407F03|nr:glycosyltransferase family 4 protein [Bradyrhizobium sp. ORS 285]CCD89076.1 putative glycosyltransferase, group 1 [Bradyrhizobium sp. ORS 285]SMX61788.1 putative glycosyltransferase, group 1 [Bradyrhizobium sp. ORS 285]
MMSGERVLFVDHTGQIGGAELILLDVVQGRHESSAFLFEQGPLAKALSDRGLSVVTSRWGIGLSRFRRDSSWLKALPLAGGLAAITAELARLARRHDVVYANSQKAFVLAAVANVVARKPLIWHLHDIISPAHFGAMQRRTQILLANRFAAKVVVPSEAAAAAFIEAGGRRCLIEVVPNGLSVEPVPVSRQELRQRLGLPPAPLVGVFSRLAQWKGQHVLVEALAKLPGVHGIIVGDALFGEQDYAAQLKRQVTELGLADRIHFLGHRGDVPLLMQAVDAMVHPSIDPEPFGRTLVEAMLAGVPVIATDAGAAPDILEHGRAGMLVPPGDARALAEALDSVLSEPSVLASQLVYAARRARTQYSLTRMLDSIGLLIRNVRAGAAV